MTTQTELFPKTTMEVLESLRVFHVADVEKAQTGLDNLADDEKVAHRYEKAEERLAAARDLVRDIDRAIMELRGMEPTVEDAVRDMKRTAEESGTQVTLSTGGKSVTFGAKAVDPITGEVDDSSCDTCGNDCNLRQREGSGQTGCGGDNWKARTPEVLVAWPGNPDMQHVAVGALTRYGELAAKFLNSLPGDDPRRTDSFLDYRVVCLGGPFCTDLEERALDTVIAPADYGLEFSVEPPAKAEESAA